MRNSTARALTLALLSALTAPCVAQPTVIRAETPFYAAEVTRSGGYGVLTGSDHAATGVIGEPAVVIAGNSTAVATNLLSIRSYSSHTDYTCGAYNLATPVTDAGYACFIMENAAPGQVQRFTDPDGKPGVLSIREIRGPSDNFAVEQKLIVRGGGVSGSYVEVTLSVQNLGPHDALIGIRLLWDWQLSYAVNAVSHDVTIATRPPESQDGPFPTQETEWLDPSFRSILKLTDPLPLVLPDVYQPYFVEASVRDLPLAPPPTPPDRIVYGPLANDGRPNDPVWRGISDHCFSYDLGTLPKPIYHARVPGVAYYWGDRPETARVIPPGETLSVTEYVAAYIRFPLTCIGGGPYLAECEGRTTMVALDGTASSNVEGEGYGCLWTTRHSAVSLHDAGTCTPLATMAGLGHSDVNLLVHQGALAKGCTASIDVVDTSPPIVRSAQVTPEILWPPNHKMSGIHVGIDAYDTCEGPPRILLNEVRSNEPDDAPGLGDGNTTEDIQGAEIGTPDFDLLLRAERDGRGEGRTYTLVYEVTDSSGNSTLVPLEVRVPHDRRTR